MVLESLLNPKKAEDNPIEVFLVALVYSFVAVFFSHALFPQQSSILTVAFITILFVPFFQKLFAIEEKKDDVAAEKKIRMRGGFFRRHSKAIVVFSAFFLGVIVALSFIFLFLPSYGQVFYLQTSLPPLNKMTGGMAGGVTGAITAQDQFTLFFMNNTQVMILAFIFSVLFGAGAVFVFAWNASVIATYIGLISRSLIDTGMSSGTAYFYGITSGLGGIALHGIPEIVAYFIAGLAGGILSIGVMRERIASKEFKLIFVDSIKLLILAEVLIFGAAWLEAFV